MTVLQEDTVRQLYFKQGVTRFQAAEWDYITQQAKAFIKDHGLELAEACSDGENQAIQPPAEPAGKGYVTQEGTALSEKPEHMTHLYGNVLVSKGHPRICLRGKLDGLEADIIALQAALEQGDPLYEQLEELLARCRAILTCEVTGKPLAETALFGLDSAALRERSQHPKRFYGIGHILPSGRDGAVMAGLNCLRTRARETELAAVAAFVTPAGTDRADLLQALNRLSSAFYVLMLSRKSGKAPDTSRLEQGGR